MFIKYNCNIMRSHSRNTFRPRPGFGSAAEGNLYPRDVLADLAKMRSNIVVPLERGLVRWLPKHDRVHLIHDRDKILFRVPRTRRFCLRSGRLTKPVTLCKYPLARDRSVGLFSDVAAAHTHEHVPPEKIALPQTAGMRGDCSGCLAWTPKD